MVILPVRVWIKWFIEKSSQSFCVVCEIENCGSCFAAEQFVDIELGSKALLPLTS